MATPLDKGADDRMSVAEWRALTPRKASLSCLSLFVLIGAGAAVGIGYWHRYPILWIVCRGSTGRQWCLLALSAGR